MGYIEDRYSRIMQAIEILNYAKSIVEKHYTTPEYAEILDEVINALSDLAIKKLKKFPNDFAVASTANSSEPYK